jgi:hypothetical protein
MMSDKEFAEVELRATICPAQCNWPKPENTIWQKLHAVPREARERVSKACAQMDKIDGDAFLSPEDKHDRRSMVAAQAFAEFDASQTLLRAREAAAYDGSPAVLKAFEQAKAGWERVMNKIAERAGRSKGPIMGSITSDRF